MKRKDRTPLKLPDISECPFCGSDKLTVQQTSTEDRGDGYVIDCNHCGASGPQKAGMANACLAWNARSQAGSIKVRSAKP
jgi:Lar family restriction alleviation protein